MQSILNVINTGLTQTTLVLEPPASITLNQTTLAYKRIGRHQKTFSRPLQEGHWEETLQLRNRNVLLGGYDGYVPEMVRAEGDATIFCHDEIIAVMRAAFAPLGGKYRMLAQLPSTSGKVVADLVCFQDDVNKVIALLELKRPGYINVTQWSQQDLRNANEHTQRLTRKIRRYAHEYDCTQYLLFDCCTLLKIEFEATGNEIQNTDRINIEIAYDTRYEQRAHVIQVLGRGEDYATVRAVIYSSILAGIRRHLFANIQPATISPPDGSNYVYLGWTPWSGGPLWYNDQNQTLQLRDPFGWTHFIERYAAQNDDRRGFRFRIVYIINGAQHEMIRDI
ncbi:uncharacterized protein PV09_09668 [Verruconis gallopava]|uniref:Uncharacterized protein n=1 Tax=Verruconis gallopava TaxID=253628 RepID=A0A0D1ZX05_9PEZI|nr:uncharacterized protein PV09_09668 [Verruconis gallopava]KIV98534.1 hypothetical protein PV09_09668 [Verruconis gallopava]